MSHPGKSHKDPHRDKFKHSATGAFTKNRGEPAKHGAGKGNWGKEEDFASPGAADLDPRDPNYDDSQDPVHVLVYRVTTEAEWERAKARGDFRGGELDERDGYIHMSPNGEVSKTVKAYYKGQESLVLLEVDPNKIQQGLVWEKVEARDNMEFPHLYGTLSTHAVVHTYPLPLKKDGSGHHDLPAHVQ